MAQEKNFENQVKDFLKQKNCWFIKYWGGGEFTRSGVPDILCCCNGYFLGIELKAPNGKPTRLQIEKLKQIDKAGGFGILLYPKHYTLFKNLIDCILDNDNNIWFNYSMLKRVVEDWERKLDKEDDESLPF